MSGFAQFLRIKRCTETQRHARTEKDVVRQGGDTAVIDLGLFQS